MLLAGVLAVVLLGAAWLVARPWLAGRGQPIAGLSGTLNVLVWRPGDSAVAGLPLNDPKVLPVRSGDQVRVLAQLNRPAYVYLGWIDTEGRAAPVYPWVGGKWDERPQREMPTDHLNLPLDADQSWQISGPAGMETLMLLARTTPLPKEFRLEDCLAGLPQSTASDPGGLVAFRDGHRVLPGTAEDRGAKLAAPVRLPDSLLAAQASLAKQLEAHFVLNLAQSFANQGE